MPPRCRAVIWRCEAPLSLPFYTLTAAAAVKQVAREEDEEVGIRDGIVLKMPSSSFSRRALIEIPLKSSRAHVTPC